MNREVYCHCQLWFIYLFISVWVVHDISIWSFSLLHLLYKAPEYVSYVFIINTQCPPQPLILWLWSVYISNTGPGCIHSYTPLWMINISSPFFEFGMRFYRFDVLHIISTCSAVGTIMLRLAARALDIHITADCVWNADVKISNCNNIRRHVTQSVHISGEMLFVLNRWVQDAQFSYCPNSLIIMMCGTIFLKFHPEHFGNAPLTCSISAIVKVLY